MAVFVDNHTSTNHEVVQMHDLSTKTNAFFTQLNTANLASGTEFDRDTLNAIKGGIEVSLFRFGNEARKSS